jgi:hypothetical protein
VCLKNGIKAEGENNKEALLMPFGQSTKEEKCETIKRTKQLNLRCLNGSEMSEKAQKN